MSKKIHCPNCGSNKMILKIPQTSIWNCQKCGYTGAVFIEDGNIEKNLKETRKMDKLSKKLLKGR